MVTSWARRETLHAWILGARRHSRECLTARLIQDLLPRPDSRSELIGYWDHGVEQSKLTCSRMGDPGVDHPRQPLAGRWPPRADHHLHGLWDWSCLLAVEQPATGRAHGFSVAEAAVHDQSAAQSRRVPGGNAEELRGRPVPGHDPGVRADQEGRHRALGHRRPGRCDQLVRCEPASAWAHLTTVMLSRGSRKCRSARPCRDHRPCHRSRTWPKL